MDTITFLRHVLPDSGIKFLAHWRDRPGHTRGGVMIHVPTGDVDDLAAEALRIDRTTNDNVYFALATYKEVIYKTKGDRTYPAGRVQSNALQVKCLWMDWDVGKDNSNSYATRDEALAGVTHYVTAAKLPGPLVVHSGYGIHTYWVFDEAVAADEWESIAKYQRVILKHLGVKFDPSRDKDCASILRPVGTRNKKAGREPKVVRVASTAIPDTLPAQEYKRRLKGYCLEHGLMDQVQVNANIPAYLQGTKGNLSGLQPDYPDSYAVIAVQHCGQLQEFSRSGGCSEPVWYACLGVLKHMKDGEHYAHLWSSEHAEYDKAHTQAKLDQWTAGPTTCDRFREINATGCIGCKHSCKSPVQLGHSNQVEAPVAPSVEEPTAPVLPTATDATTDDGRILNWPDGFEYKNASDTIYAVVPDENGVNQHVRVASPLFYPVSAMVLEDGTYALHCKAKVRGQIREFDLPTKHLADTKTLKASLCARQMTIHNDKLVQQFLTASADKIRRTKEEIHTYQQLGWHHDYKAFLLGDQLITADDEIKIVKGHWLRSHDTSVFETSGTRDLWVDGINELYNRPHAEPHQLIIGNAFGSILSPLLRYNEWHGIPVALTSNDSGYGKSTVAKLAHSIYCQQKSRSMSVIEDATVKAILPRVSVMNNLPLLLDEVTKFLKDPVHMSDTLYALSNGGPRDGCNSDGTLRGVPPGWCGCCVMTGNRGVLHQLTESKINPEATQMRVFEIDLDGYPRIATMTRGSDEYRALNSKHQLITQHLLENSYGVVGREWVRWVMKHRAEVEEKLRSTSLKLRGLMASGDHGDATKERYYYHWATCTLVGLYFAKKLGLVDFNVTQLTHWIVKHVARLRNAVSEYRDTAEDHFAAMMSTMVGRLIVTKTFETLDMRHGQGELSILPVNRSPVSGRMVLGTDKERSKLYITTKAVAQWCQEAGVSYTAFRRDALKEGIIRLGTPKVNRETGTVKVSIGRGVPGYQNMGNPTCFEFDADRAAAVIPMPDANNTDVIHLNREAA